MSLRTVLPEFAVTWRGVREAIKKSLKGFWEQLKIREEFEMSLTLF